MPLTEADTINCNWVKSVDIGSIGSLGPIRYLKVFLGHLDVYFENWEIDPKSLEIYSIIPWSISKISVKFIELVVIGAIDWPSRTIIGIGRVPDAFLVTDS